MFPGYDVIHREWEQATANKRLDYNGPEWSKSIFILDTANINK